MILKFRAWMKSLKWMCDVTNISFDSKFVDICQRGDTERYTEMSVEFDEIELMQSTGLFDKNGKEIFEGDIVKMSKDIYSEPTYYEVVRHRGGAYRLDSKQHGCELWLRHTDCEVVGNVFENKELLDA
nr:MAG TPA: YopX protein [Caudoviricetes sp.]